MPLYLTILLLAVALVVAMSFAWLVTIRTKRSGFIDAIWSYATGLAGIAAALAPFDGAAPLERRWLAAGLVGLWSLRLGTHILLRGLKGGDDPRYAQLRRDWGAKYRSQLFVFLQIQAAVALVLALAVLAAAHNPAPVGWVDLVAIVVAAIAICGEALSDAQLAAFRGNPANHGRVCDIGLWGLSRHPNYFFEWLYWLSIPVLGAGYIGGAIALLAPLMMYWLLVHVSGIPPLEAHMLRSRPAAFAAYQQRVPAFWPLPLQKKR